MAAQQAAPLLLTASEGPWMWRVVKYGLLAGALDPLTSMHTQHSIHQFASLGSVVATAHGEWPRSSYADAGLSFRFEGAAEEPEPQELKLRLSSFDGAGVGHQVWDSAIVMALLMRSPTAPPLPPRPRILELGAGVGLPGLDLARLHESVVTLSDTRSKLLRLLEHNALANAACRGDGATVDVRELTWGGGNETLAAAEEQEQQKEKAAAAGTAEGEAEAACHPKEERCAGAYDLVVGGACYAQGHARAVAPVRTPTILMSPSGTVTPAHHAHRPHRYPHVHALTPPPAARLRAQLTCATRSRASRRSSTSSLRSCARRSRSSSGPRRGRRSERSVRRSRRCRASVSSNGGSRSSRATPRPRQRLARRRATPWATPATTGESCRAARISC